MPVLEWKRTALTDLLSIISYIAANNPAAAQILKNQIAAKTALLPDNPKLYRAGRVEGTREMVVRPSYVVVYTEDTQAVTILRILRTAQHWPPQDKADDAGISHSESG